MKINKSLDRQINNYIKLTNFLHKISEFEGFKCQTDSNGSAKLATSNNLTYSQGATNFSTTVLA